MYMIFLLLISLLSCNNLNKKNTLETISSYKVKSNISHLNDSSLQNYIRNIFFSKKNFMRFLSSEKPQVFILSTEGYFLIFWKSKKRFANYENLIAAVGQIVDYKHKLCSYKKIYFDYRMFNKYFVIKRTYMSCNSSLFVPIKFFSKSDFAGICKYKKLVFFAPLFAQVSDTNIFESSWVVASNQTFFVDYFNKSFKCDFNFIEDAQLFSATFLKDSKQSYHHKWQRICAEQGILQIELIKLLLFMGIGVGLLRLYYILYRINAIKKIKSPCLCLCIIFLAVIIKYFL